MVKVYFEKGGYAELRAVFCDDATYALCFEQLAWEAGMRGYILTESVEDEIELSDLIK